MEPLHITEFASERYFSKLRQISENANNANQQSGSSPTVPATPSQPSPLEAATFNLPSRQRNANHNHDNLVLRPSDQRKRSLGHDLTSLRTQRRPSFSGSFGSLRSKVTTIHRTPSIVETQQEVIVEERAVRHHVTLSDLFLSLPNELQAQIIAPLPIHTILDLRLVSRSFHALVTLNEAPIARYHAMHTLPAYTMRLYPLPDPAKLNLHYLGGIWHRLHVASKLSMMISLQAQKEIFLQTTEAQKAGFQPQFNRMRQRLIPLVFTIFHFFETYRALYTQHLAARGPPLSRLPFTLNPFECHVMSMYDDRTLLYVHQVFPLVMSSFSRRLRPPSYVGRVERSIRGYLKDRPADEVYATILTIGGLRQAQRFWETKGYNARRAAVDAWYGFLQTSKAPLVEATPKSKMSRITHLGRRKNPPPEPPPTDNMGHDVTSCNEWFCVKPNCVSARKHPSGHNLVFHTSLSAGPPMSPLTRDQLRLILPDIPDLHDIWAKTAEALILERRIVDRPAAIKKNSQVLLDLIKEDGREEMDAWSPGRTNDEAREVRESMDNSGAVSD